MSLSDSIADAIRTVLHDTGRDRKVIEPSMLLSSDLGFDSLDIAQAVVLLERSLGIDPFRTPLAGSARPSIRTVADLIAIYSTAIASQ
ncbi:MAG: acyl carrier protein [Planctomycetota bacterium]